MDADDAAVFSTRPNRAARRFGGQFDKDVREPARRIRDIRTSARRLELRCGRDGRHETQLIAVVTGRPSGSAGPDRADAVVTRYVEWPYPGTARPGGRTDGNAPDIIQVICDRCDVAWKVAMEDLREAVDKEGRHGPAKLWVEDIEQGSRPV